MPPCVVVLHSCDKYGVPESIILYLALGGDLSFVPSMGRQIHDLIDIRLESHYMSRTSRTTDTFPDARILRCTIVIEF